MSASTPRLPSVTQMIWSLSICSDLRRIDEPPIIVAVAKLGLRQQTELGFIEDQDIDEIEQLAAEIAWRRRIEDRGGAGGAGALEEGDDGGQGNLELADRDVALRKCGRGDIGGAEQRVRAGNDDDGVVGIGDRDDRRSAMGFSGLPHEAEVDSLRGEKRLQLVAERILAEPADQRDLRAELGGRTAWLAPLPPGK